VGGGELRIGALMGLALGWKIALIALFVAYFLGAIAAPILIYWRKKTAQSLIPFGPFLALAVWISLFWGELILNGYLGLIGVM
jgi:leader peptidase (prepilin peptidase)/N-methyltransferase